MVIVVGPTVFVLVLVLSFRIFVFDSVVSVSGSGA